MISRKKTLIIRSVLAGLLAVSSVLYLLADRYLIEHVEIANVGAANAEVVSPTNTTAATVVSETAISVPATAEATVEATAAVFADDWNYVDETVSISITQVSTDNLTYFVADVVLAEATELQSAFAKDSFGQNIIEYTSEIASAHNAIFAINGDYYGFRDDGIVIRNGVIFRDSPARTGLAFYLDGSMKIYDETQTTAEQLLADGVWNTLSFGPALLENGEIMANLESVEVDTNFGNHSIQGSHPRTGVGIIAENHFVFVVVDGRSPGYSTGVTLTEFAQIFKDLGSQAAYNIDGGGSSTMFFMGRVVNNPLGKNQERGTSDILFIN